MHATDTTPRERDTKHVKVQKVIDVHLKTLKSLIIISKEVSTICTRASKCASAHSERSEAFESFCEQSIIHETLICGLKL